VPYTPQIPVVIRSKGKYALLDKLGGELAKAMEIAVFAKMWQLCQRV